MRIIAGEHRGRAIVAPKRHSTRPTADRTRQALFNVLDHAPWAPALNGARVIDLFAGSGALGLEALSRGAAFCRFVDHDASAVEAIHINIAALRLEARSNVVQGEAARGAVAGDPFDLAFLDPPYGKTLDEQALVGLATSGLLSADAVVAVERASGDPALDAPRFTVLETRVWGAARVWFLRLAPPPR